MENQKTTTKDRLVEFLAYKHITKTEFGKMVGVSASYITSMKKSVSNKVLAQIAVVFPELNTEWLTLGNGNMLRNHPTAKPADTTHMITAHLVSKFAHAGYLSGYGDNEYMEELPVVTFVAEHETHGNYMAFEVRGDSMDDGTRAAYCDGDIVLCREIEREYWRDSRLFINRRDFVLVTKDGILIKRIIRHDVDTHTITIHSLNPFYKDVEINLIDVLQIFSVVFRQNNMQR